MDSEELIRVAIVDDHAMVRQGLVAFLYSYSDLKLVGEAANGQEALTLCAEKHPHVVLMDLMMPVMDGLTATRHIRRDYPDIRVIALTSFAEETLIRATLEAGVTSYLFKQISADDLARAIRRAKAGISTFAPEVTDILVQSIQSPGIDFHDLTPREKELLALMVKGMGNKEIGAHLSISLSTTKSHISNILSKLGLGSRTEAIVKILQHNSNTKTFSPK